MISFFETTSESEYGVTGPSSMPAGAREEVGAKPLPARVDTFDSKKIQEPRVLSESLVTPVAQTNESSNPEAPRMSGYRKS